MPKRRAKTSPAAAAPPSAEVKNDGTFIDVNASPSMWGPAGGSALYNPVTGQGVEGRDPTIAYRWRSPRRLLDHEIEAITVDGIGRRGVAIRGWEATREWGAVKAPRSPLPADVTAKVLQWLEQRAEQLHLRTRTSDLERERERWGDAAMIRAIGSDDATWRDPAPGFAAGVDAVRVRSLRVLRGRGKDYRPTALHEHGSTEWGEAAEIVIPSMALPANAEDAATWGTMNLSTRSREVRVHASRFHRLSTIDGRSDLDGVSQRLAELHAAARGAAQVSARPAIPFVKGRTIGSQLRANPVRARSAWGQAHAEAGEGSPLMLDLAQGEEAGYVGPPGGLSVVEPITGLGYMLCAAWGIPMTLLFGMSPGGLNSPGDSEERNWNNVVRSVQSELTPAVLEVYRALAAELAATLRALAEADVIAGNVETATERRDIAAAVAKLDLAFDWRPLRVLDAVEEADWRYKTAQWQQIYMDRNVIRADEIRASTFGGDGFRADVQTVDKAGVDEVQKSIPVGTAQAALSTLIAAAAGQISSDTAKAMLTALDPGFSAVAATLAAGAVAANPAPLPGTPAPAPVADGPVLPDVWTEPEIRKALRVGKKTIARWVSEGKLRPMDMGGGHRRYRKAEVIAMWEGDPEAQQEAADDVARLDALDAAAEAHRLARRESRGTVASAGEKDPAQKAT